MYAKLGDIIFENLVGMDSMVDKRATVYAQHPLLTGKAVLDKVGEELIEFSLTTQYHVSFCNPEDEFAKLNNARIAGIPLTFQYGNGFIEGDFVITSIEKTVLQTDATGNYILISVSFTLLEFISGNSAAIQQARDKSNAFAVSSNRPLPSNPNLQPDNPALDVMNENKKAGQASNKITALKDKLNATTEAATGTPPISTAQAFVDQIPQYVQDANKQLTAASVALNQIQNLITLYGSLVTEQPGLTAAVLDAQNGVTLLSNQNTILGTLPTTISTVPQANTALGELYNVTTLTVAFAKNISNLNTVNQTIAKAIVLKKNFT